MSIFDEIRKFVGRALDPRDPRPCPPLATFPLYFSCAGCGLPLRGAVSGLALGIRTRWRYVDGVSGPVTLPDGRKVSIQETPDICSGACFERVVSDPAWLVWPPEESNVCVGMRRVVEGGVQVRGEWCYVYCGEQTEENVQKVLAAEPLRQPGGG